MFGQMKSDRFQRNQCISFYDSNARAVNGGEKNSQHLPNLMSEQRNGKRIGISSAQTQIEVDDKELPADPVKNCQPIQ